MCTKQSFLASSQIEIFLPVILTVLFDTLLGTPVFCESLFEKRLASLRSKFNPILDGVRDNGRGGGKKRPSSVKLYHLVSDDNETW